MAPTDSPNDPEAGSVVDPEVLAQRRARRAEQADEPVLERAERAERMVAALELRLGEAEVLLAERERDRSAAATELERAERELTTARQHEYAERRLRVEIEGETGGAVRRLEESVVLLRTQLAAAESHARESARTLHAARAEADALRVRARSGVELAAAERLLSALQVRTDELEGVAARERSARERAEHDAAAEREAARVQLARLRDELDRRHAAQAAVDAVLGELRAGLGAVRARVEDGERRHRLELERAATENRNLRASLTALGLERDRARTQLDEGRAELRVREAELRAVLDDERLRRTALEALVAAERARSAEELARSEAALEREHSAYQAETEALTADATRRTADLAAADAALAAAYALAEQERERFSALAAEHAERAVAADGELHLARARADAIEAAHRALEAELEERTRLEAEVRVSLDALEEGLGDAHRDQGERDAREAAVEALITELAGTADRLRAGYEHELAELTTARDAELAGERAAYAAELSSVEARVADLRAELAAAARMMRDQGGAPASVNPIYDTISQRPLSTTTPPPDHPALVGSGPPPADAEPPAAVSDLARAMERLRAAVPGPVEPDQPEPAPVVPERVASPPAPPVVAPQTPAVAPRPRAVSPQAPAVAPQAPVVAPRPRAVAPRPRVVAPRPRAVAFETPGGRPEPAAVRREPVAPFGPAVTARPSLPSHLHDLPVPPSRRAPASPSAPGREEAWVGLRPIVDAPPGTGWFAGAVAAFAEIDARTAECLFLASLAVQAQRTNRAIAYDVVLPLTGRHHVEVRPGGRVAVGPGALPAQFVVEGPVAALGPLASGGAARRLRGAEVRGSRRRLRRLLRALRAPVGLNELAAARADPRPGDLLALLCSVVPAGSVAGHDFGVAYIVTPAGERSVRTLVRAEPDGSLTAIPEAPELFPADATVRADGIGHLLALLSGARRAVPEGDADAVATLQRWFHEAQRDDGGDA